MENKDLDNIIAFDCEVFPNYWLIAFKESDTKKLLNIEICGKDTVLSERQKSNIKRVFEHKVLMSFNGERYDMPIIGYALAGMSCSQIHQLSDKIIDGNEPTFRLITSHGIKLPQARAHFDIMQIGPKTNSSLKAHGARLHSNKLQELPVEPGTLLTEAEIDIIRSYCENDLDTLIDLYFALKDCVELRILMGNKYNMNVNSKRNVAMAEMILKHKIEAKTQRRFYRPTFPSNFTFKFAHPHWFTPKTKQLIAVKELISSITFGLTPDGRVKLPKDLTTFKIEYNDVKFKIGIGGLHSNERHRTVDTKKNEFLYDCDVESYYPNILISLNMYPKQCGPAFSQTYKEFLEVRLKVKAEKKHDSTKHALDESLKIVLSGTFGKFGNKYSSLYAPELLAAVTLTGQLGLLYLIEQLTLGGFKVVSSNTDSVMTLVHDNDYDAYQLICKNWQTETKFKLEEVQYTGLYSRSVNDYFATKTDKGTKTRGTFRYGDLILNLNKRICTLAAMNFIIDGKPIADTILSKDADFRHFLISKNVTGGALYKDAYVGKTVRFVHTMTGTGLFYKSNGNKVQSSEGAEPVAKLENLSSYQIDYDRYIDFANKIVADTGYYHLD